MSILARVPIDSTCTSIYNQIICKTLNPVKSLDKTAAAGVTNKIWKIEDIIKLAD